MKKVLLLILLLVIFLLACGNGEQSCQCYRVEVLDGESELQFSECVRWWNVKDGVMSYTPCVGLPISETYGNIEGLTVLQNSCCTQ